MSRRYSEAEAVALIEGLTLAQLNAFIRARFVVPLATAQGPLYREADIARLQLLCDLRDSYEIDEDALRMVISLVDQLNTMRGDMRALMTAVASEPDEVRQRVGSTLRRVRVWVDQPE